MAFAMGCTIVVQKFSHGRLRRQGHNVCGRYGICQVMGAVQMGVDRNHIVKQPRQKATNDGLADGLAHGKRPVLTHVTQIRGHQRQSLRTQLACGGGRQ